MSRFFLAAALILGLLAMVGGVAVFQRTHAPREISIRTEDFGTVKVRAPSGEPKAFVIMLSDSDGMTPALDQRVESLVAVGIAVVPLATRSVMQGLAASNDGECHYAFGDFEDISRDAQRSLGVGHYKWPVILGLGEGGTLAYLSMAQAPVNTAAGAISVGFSTTLASKLPLCSGAPFLASASGGAFAYGPFERLPGRWLALSAMELDPKRAAFVAASPQAESRVVSGSSQEQFDVAIKAVFEMGASPHGELSDLPLIELPASGPPKALAVFYSGDGGWRDIDKTIADLLNQRGIAVIGVDSLRYFWTAKTPREIASDLDRIVATYQNRWRIRKVALLGYSMGAGALPFAWSALAPKTQKDTALVALLGLAPQSSFQVSVSTFLGLPSPADVDVKPALKTLPVSKVMCFYGSAEQAAGETACLAGELSGATLIERPGGHHFDENYEPIAKAILDRLAAAIGESQRAVSTSGQSGGSITRRAVIAASGSGSCESSCSDGFRAQ
jgi:type IV secretory pathway VirJ component